MDGFKKLFDTGRKILAVWVLLHATIWIDLSYILAFMDKKDIAESLSSNVVTTVIVVFAVYATASVAEHISEAKYGTIKTNKKDTEAPI